MIYPLKGRDENNIRVLAFWDLLFGAWWNRLQDERWVYFQLVYLPFTILEFLSCIKYIYGINLHQIAIKIFLLSIFHEQNIFVQACICKRHVFATMEGRRYRSNTPVLLKHFGQFMLWDEHTPKNRMPECKVTYWLRNHGRHCEWNLAAFFVSSQKAPSTKFVGHLGPAQWKC